MVNQEDVEPKNMIEFGTLMSKLSDLSPEKTGEPWAEGERFFYWGKAHANNTLWNDIMEIFETIERLGGSGWGLWMGHDSIIDQLSANGASYWDSDVYPAMGWDDRESVFGSTGKSIAKEDLFPDMFGP